MDANQIYQQHVQSLSEAERLRLVGQIVDGIAQERGAGLSRGSILELRGKGAEVWRGVDAAAYVDELRREWDQRP